MEKKTICVPLLLLCFVYAVLSSFDCRRRGQFCQNGGTCPDGSPNCTCSEDWAGYDCSYNKSLAEQGACNMTQCENGGTCVETKANDTECICPAAYYGETCSFKRFQVVCNSSSLLLGINPLGNFSGYIYVEDKRDTCQFDSVDNLSINETAGWQGYARDVAHKEKNCSVITPVYNPKQVENETLPDNATTSYTRVVYVVYEKTFYTSLDEVLTFTCLFDTKSVAIGKRTETEQLDVKDLQQQTTTATLSPVEFDILNGKGDKTREKVKLGDELTLEFKVDATSFDGARLESCVFNDTKENGDKLTVVDDSCIQDDAKSILSKPLDYKNDNVTIIITLKIRVFKFVKTDKLGVQCKVKACPLGQSNNCKAKSCSDGLDNENGYGRRRRDAEESQETEVGSILVVDFSNDPEETAAEPTKDDTKPIFTPTCSITKEVTAIMAALGTVTLILLIFTIVLLSRAVITKQSSKAKGKDEPSDTYSNLGQPKAFSRKY